MGEMSDLAQTQAWLPCLFEPSGFLNVTKQLLSVLVGYITLEGLFVTKKHVLYVDLRRRSTGLLLCVGGNLLMDALYLGEVFPIGSLNL